MYSKQDGYASVMAIYNNRYTVEIACELDSILIGIGLSLRHLSLYLGIVHLNFTWKLR